MSLLKLAGQHRLARPKLTIEDEIIAVLSAGPQPSINAIASLLPRRRSDVYSTMTDLQIKGRIVRSAEGWRINEGEAA
jgi:hypothetical protein